MLLEHEVKRLISELVNADVAQIDIGGSCITVKACEEGNKIFLSTPVYFGGNYIPKSVRYCLTHRAPFQSYSTQTTLKVDEDNFKVYLNHLGDIENMNKTRFIDLLENFSGLAERWREYLEEHDQNDLVHIPIR